jgi:hypothetical protein
MSPDTQFLINLFIALCGSFGAYVLHSVSVEMQDLAKGQRDLAAKVDAMPNVYARRDDMKDAVDRIEATLHRIEAKLDQKADK